MAAKPRKPKKKPKRKKKKQNESGCWTLLIPKMPTPEEHIIPFLLGVCTGLGIAIAIATMVVTWVLR